MKKLVTAIFCIGFAMSVQAQDSTTRITPVSNTSNFSSNSKSMRFGFCVQPLVSWIKPDSKNVKSGGAKMGISGGLAAEFYFADHYAFSTGLLISQLGGNVNFPVLTAANSDTPRYNVKYNYSTRFVEIPLLLKLKTEEFGYMRVYGEFGTSLGFLWSAKADLDQNVFPASDVEGNQDRHVNANGKDFNLTVSSAEEDNTMAFRMPLLVGGGIEYALSENTTLLVGARYSSGVTNFFSAAQTKGFLSYGSLAIGILF